MKCDKYSMPFKVILKPIAVLPRSLQVNINEDARVRSLFGKLQEYITRDSSETEAEIRRLTKEMNQRRQQAEMDFQRIVTLIESSISNTASTKSLSSEDIGSLTPPVTPESINEKMMNIDDHLPQPMKSVAFAKHSSVIQQQHITRTIDFDDDIFELDGMQEEPKNDQDRYHKYSDTDEGSDGEKMTVEKRAMNRGRSGSINFARSAPISMPMFNHHAIHAIDTDDDKAVNDQQMDIASSIKMLARSIHADSVFGELPGHVRSVRYNTEF
jgi:proline-rich AKT1 substrate 1